MRLRVYTPPKVINVTIDTTMTPMMLWVAGYTDHPDYLIVKIPRIRVVSKIRVPVILCIHRCQVQYDFRYRFEASCKKPRIPQVNHINHPWSSKKSKEPAGSTAPPPLTMIPQYPQLEPWKRIDLGSFVFRSPPRWNEKSKLMSVFYKSLRSQKI